MMGFVPFNDEADQYLCAAVLRPGNVTAAAGAVGILRRLMALIRHTFPKARIRVRLDDGFANPELLEFLESEPGVEYVVAMASNAVLERKASQAMQVARVLAGVADQTEHVYGETNYAAGTWKRERRVIIKAAVVRAEGKEPKDNPRFVITNMKQTPQWLYEEIYCQRGEIENRIKELHALEIDRTSCSRFWANQFRVLLTAAAYVLMQELRLQAALTDCARAQVSRPERARPRKRIPGMVGRNASSAGEWCSLKNSTAVARAALIKATTSRRNEGNRAETNQ
jgi:hypothetical protein